jgi:hypothetical protein
MEHGWMLTIKYGERALDKVRNPVFPAITDAPLVSLRRRRFLQTPQEPFYYSPSHASV